MSDKSWSKAMWDGKYGGFFGFGSSGVLAQKRAACLAAFPEDRRADVIAYASALHRVVGDPAWRYAPLRVVAFFRLRSLLVKMVAEAMREDGSRLWNPGTWTVGQCETMVGILKARSRSPYLSMRRQKSFKRASAAFLMRGMDVMDEDPSAHTRAFLYLHTAGTMLENGILADAQKRTLGAMRLVDDISTPDQKARVCRKIAEMCVALDKAVPGSLYLDQARVHMRYATSLPEISESVMRKNEAVRKRLGL